MPQKFLSIKNLEKYQTNRKNAPPWFKIHRLMFGDPEFVKLSTAYRFLYIGLIHLAVESGNKIYNDDTFILQRLYIPSTDGILKTTVTFKFPAMNQAGTTKTHGWESCNDVGTTTLSALTYSAGL